MRLRKKNLSVFLATIVFSFSALGHGGGVDAKGCHRDSSTGARHCHKRKVGEVLSGRVVRVSDGDTLKLRTNGRTVKVRLSSIDCPELEQSYGEAAKAVLQNLILQKTVKAEVLAKDRYQRRVARLYLDSLNVNRILVRQGHCWHYRRYSRDPVLIDLEAEARSARRGLWLDDNPVEPWIWRKSRKN